MILFKPYGRLFLFAFVATSLNANLALALDELPPVVDTVTPVVETVTTPVIPEPTAPAVTETPVYNDLFPDLKVGSQFYIGTKYLKDTGLIQGYPDGTYKPLQLVNRAEALKVLNNAFEFQSMSNNERPIVNAQSIADAEQKFSGCLFPDLDKQAWYFSYVCTAFNNKVIAGYPDGTFKPEQNINRAEALKMLVLQSGLSTQTPTAENFDDVAVSDWFNDYARIANQKSFIVEDRSGNLTPALKMNRGEFGMMIYRTIKATRDGAEFGKATYYGGRFDGKTTASGETFSGNLPTAAHKTLPFGTIVKVTNLTNGKTVTVRINDRGPYVNGAIIDLSTVGFKEIASLSTGVVDVQMEILSTP